jgi:hypothetical protein
MEEMTLTTTQIADLIRIKLPWIARLLEEAQNVKYGQMEIKFEIRAGNIEKMTFFNASTWLKEKDAALTPQEQVIAKSFEAMLFVGN